MKQNSIVMMPTWLRVFSIISGSISIIFALIVLINIKFDYFITALLFGLALIIIGITRILIGIFDKERQSKWIRIFNAVIGVIMLPIGILSVIKQDITIRLVYVFISVALLFLGIIGVVKGFEEKKKESWYRILLISYGFLLVIIATLNMSLDEIAQITLKILLSIGFMLLGFRRLMEGIIGQIIIKSPETIEEG